MATGYASDLLPVGKVFRIGRKNSCNLVIPSPLISAVHCTLKVTDDPFSSASARVTLCDKSRNGTWVREKHKSVARKAPKQLPFEIFPGDVIMLLAPGHKQTSFYKYMLVADSGVQYRLQQLDPKGSGKKGRKRILEDSEAPGMVKKMLIEAEGTAKASAANTDVKEEIGRCPICRDLFPVTSLPIHCPACQRSGVKKPATTSSPESPALSTEVGECPKCRKTFPVLELIAHCEGCTGGEAAAPSSPPHLESVGSFEECPNCSALVLVVDMFKHSAVCNKRFDGETEVDSVKKGLEIQMTKAVKAPEDMLELEQCMFCLNDFPLCEIVEHYSICESAKKKSDVTEHCQHCLKIFPLDELVSHSLNCSQRKDKRKLINDEIVDSEGELERCIHCFMDFPLSQITEHCSRCTGDMLGSKERFKNFIPSVHDLDPLSLTVLTPIQREAVDYVTQKSKKDSESKFSHLMHRVIHLGYSEKELDTTLQWICRDAPIIIHINLDRCLRFLVKDTHYRNLFETRTGGGGTSTHSRIIWEDRIFNKIYTSEVSAFDRVKYGVLNIVGDPCGVKCCYSYGDSFLQLKKVRLRTTFASEDTSSSNVKLSCCEHYGNVLFEYSDLELKAILDVATRKKTFLKSDIISHYKEVQIHGPVSLSENVDCIVVNERHRSSPSMTRLLDKFVQRNKCNLIWMEPEHTINYPSFRS